MALVPWDSIHFHNDTPLDVPRSEQKLERNFWSPRRPLLLCVRQQLPGLAPEHLTEAPTFSSVSADSPAASGGSKANSACPAVPAFPYSPSGSSSGSYSNATGGLRPLRGLPRRCSPTRSVSFANAPVEVIEIPEDKWALPMAEVLRAVAAGRSGGDEQPTPCIAKGCDEDLPWLPAAEAVRIMRSVTRKRQFLQEGPCFLGVKMLFSVYLLASSQSPYSCDPSGTTPSGGSP